VRDLPWRKYQTIVVVEFYRVRCPKCGLKVEAAPQLPSKAPFSKDFEDAAGWRANQRRRGRWRASLDWRRARYGPSISGHLERWAKNRKKPVLRQMGVDEIYLGKTQKFLTVVSNLETGEPLWFGRDRKQETLDEFFRTELSALQQSIQTAQTTDLMVPNFKIGCLVSVNYSKISELRVFLEAPGPFWIRRPRWLQGRRWSVGQPSLPTRA
jgi:transposase